MTRSNIFLREHSIFDRGRSTDSLQRQKPKGFQLEISLVTPKSKLNRKYKLQQRTITPEDFAQFLAEDSEKYPEKLLPFTDTMLAQAKDLLEGIEID